jgi:serine/threonine-protein kinase HipA
VTPAPAPDHVQVLLDAPELGARTTVGTLHHRYSRSTAHLSFAYDERWLTRPGAFLVDPRLALYRGEQFPASGEAAFGIFMDSAPDRWGRVLLDRREALDALDEGRRPRALTLWDYLLGVQDEGRMGALRFRSEQSGPFLARHPLAVPPVADLPALEAVSLALEQQHAEALPSYRQWLSMLIAPGTSLGGARPKANFREADGRLWIAKFPSREDRRDVGAWEHLLYRLADEAGIEVAGCRLQRFNGPHHSFCVQRFDRSAEGRRFFVSAMTLLERRNGEGGSYLELAEFIQTQGAQDHIAGDLAQLFRRVLFNVLTGNTDDHLRNHGFIRVPSGWRLAPAYDLNPNPGRRHHALWLDEASDLPALSTVMATAPHYRLKPAAAVGILQEVQAVTRRWASRAASVGLAGSEMASVAEAFEVNDRS